MGSALANSGPRSVVLIRHAEKTGRPDDRDLSEKGRAHAAAMAIEIPRRFGPPEVIIACQSTAKSRRPVETIEPLARRLGLPIVTTWGTWDVEPLVEVLASDPAYVGKKVLICWRHDTLQQLACALGATEAPEWPETLYGWAWLIRRGSDHPRLTMEELDLDAPDDGRAS